MEISESAKEKLGMCVDELINSGWFEKAFEELIELSLSELSKKLEEYSESHPLLELFHRSTGIDLERTVYAWRTCYLSDINKTVYGLFDALKLLKDTPEDFESFAILFLSSVQILSEAYLRRLISFLVDCMNIIEGKNPKGKARYLGESLREFERFRETYLQAVVFFDEVLKTARNSFAHADYDIDVENKEIIVRDKEAMIELTEKDVEEKLSYLTRIANISIYFYLYAIYYFTKKLIFHHSWNLPRNN
jgi:hypothetical protein